jgi:hypothetical protein
LTPKGNKPNTEEAVKSLERIETLSTYLSDMGYGSIAEIESAASGYDELEKARNQWALDNTFDLYDHYMEAEDFEENSQYWDGHVFEIEGSVNPYNLDYPDDYVVTRNGETGKVYIISDPLYEYVNKKDSMKDGFRNWIIRGDTKIRDEYYDKGYDLLYPEELAVFNYIDKEEGRDKALEYLKEMSPMLTKRRYDKQTKDWEEAADSGVWADVGLSLTTIPASIVGGIGNIRATIDEKIKGEEYNPYHRARMVGNFASDTRGYIAENIAEATEGVELFGQNIPSFLYQTGMSIGDTAVGAATMGPLYSVVAGSNAFQQKAKEMKEAGEDEETIFQTAFASGMAEMVFEYISLDKLIKIKNIDSGKKIFTEALKQAGIEGSEELATELANIYSDLYIRGENSEIKQRIQDLKNRGYTDSEINVELLKEVGSKLGWAAAGGFLSGGGMGLGASTISYAKNSSLGKGIKAKERTSDMLNIASLTPQESEAYEAYTRYANKGINADNISNAQLGNLYATTDEGARKTLSSKKSTLEQKRDATETLKKLSVVDEQNTVSKDTINQIDRNIGIREAYMASADELIATGLESGKDTKSYKLATEYKQKLDNGIELTEKEIANLVKANSEAITAEDVATLSEEDAALFKSVYDGKTDKSDFFHSFELVKTLTENNYSADYILEHKGVLSAKQVSEIYKSKVLSSDASLEKAITALKEKHEGTAFIEGTFDDSVINYDNTNVEGKVNWNSLNSNQKKAIAVLGQVGKRAGMDVELISDGLERGINGAFEISGNKMLIDIYAGMDKVDGSKLQDTIIPTTSHEMTHWMKSKSPTLYRKYDNYIFGTLTMSGKSESDILSARRKKMEDAHPGEKFTDAEVRDEVIARASEDMFAKSEEIKKFLNTLTDSEKKSFVEKVKEILQNVKEWLNDFLSKQKSTSDEAKIIRQYADRIDVQIELWDKMLISSISANQALKKEGITGEKLANKTSNNVQEMARGKNTIIDKYGYNADNISRANKQGELKNEYYYALTKSEWNTFYNEITNNGYLATAIVGTVAPIRVNNKLIIAERLYTGKDAHDYTVLDAFQLEQAYDGGEALDLLAKKIEKGELIYDRQTMYQAISRILRSNQSTVVLTRFDADSQRYVRGDTKRIKGNGNEEIHRDSQKGIAGERVSLRDKPSIQKDNELQINNSDRDTLGNTLTEAQQSYFAESKAKDENGNLKMVYHGTRNADFTVFNRNVTYFTDNKSMADSYSPNGDMFEGYVNITKPYEIDAKGEKWSRIPIDDATANFLKEQGASVFKENGKWRTTPADIASAIEEAVDNGELDYDGIIIKNIDDTGSYYKGKDTHLATDYIIFNKNQFKNASNKNPTENKDIRYSDREDRYQELQTEYNQLEKEAEALKKSEEYLNFLDSISHLQGEELDNAIKEYGEWTHKSGLYDKSKRMSEIIGEQKDIRAALDNEKELSRDAYMKSIENLTEKEKMDFVNKAVKRFGTTNKISYASYLMLNGKMLDFSEGQGYRVQDHREISEILDMPDTTGYSDGLIAFMNMGNIRMQTYGIDISQAPNQSQKSALRDIISHIMRDNDEFSVDFSKANGYTDGSVTYPKGTATSKILSDIDNYFKTGVVPEYESSIAEFRYSDRDSEGHTLSKEQQDFFANSKVRDKNGNLVVCYHGTDAKFTVFDKSKINSSNGAFYGKGFYFSNSKSAANQYGNNVYEYYLNITNPLYLDDVNSVSPLSDHFSVIVLMVGVCIAAPNLNPEPGVTIAPTFA